MGSTLRVNDTLQITDVQGFPSELSIMQHIASPYNIEEFGETVFTFQDKDGIRNFQQPPVKNFLVQNYQGKHIYWGLIMMLEVRHDYLANTTSGRYQLASLYSLIQMQMAAAMTGLATNLDYFSSTFYVASEPE
ncbi:MAG: hypothetical protein AAF267_20095 [Deinococcota bacterium]